MKNAFVPIAIVILIGATCLAEAPKPDIGDHSRTSAKPGEPVDGLQCSLRLKNTQVPEGAEPVFEFRLRFNRKEADHNIKFLCRYLDARHVTVTLTNAKTGQQFARSPDDGVGGIPPDVVKEDIAVMHKPLKPLRLPVPLISPENKHVPPGTYSVAAAYRNEGKPEIVNLYKGGDVLYDGPWRFWVGTITSQPVTVEVTRVDAEETLIKTNSALDVCFVGGVGWRWSQKNPKEIRVKCRPGCVLGKSYQLHVFLNGEEMPLDERGLAKSPWDDADAVGVLPPKVTPRVQNGEKLVLRADVEIFETSVAPTRNWQPKRKGYRALWKGQIKGEMAAELQRTIMSIGQAL